MRKELVVQSRAYCHFIFTVLAVVLLLSPCGEAKVLTSKKIELLNSSLAKMPFITARLILAYKRSCLVNKELAHLQSNQQTPIEEITPVTNSEQKDTTLISSKVKFILDPVQEFFKEVKAYSWLIKPILMESLQPEHSNSSTDHKKKDEESSKNNFSSFLFTYLEDSSKDIIEFFSRELKNRADLKAFVHEVLTFLADLQASFSDQVKEEYKKFVEEIRLKKEKKDDAPSSHEEELLASTSPQKT